MWIGVGPSSSPEREAERVLAEFSKGARGSLGLTHLVVSRTTDEIVGEIGMHDRGDRIEIVYGIAPAWRGCGLATEVLTAVTRRLHSEEGSQHLELLIALSNAASICVAEKSGYRCTGRRPSLVEATGETYEDLVFVSRQQHHS